MKGGSTPIPVAAGPAFRGTAGDRRGPAVAVLDTGIGEQPRSDGWLAGLVRPDNVDPLDAIPRDGELDPGAGHGTFAAGIVQQVAPSADVRAHRVMDSAGIGSEVQVACAMLRAAAEGATVINLSLGTQSVDDAPPVALGAALELLAEHHPDVLVVAAAGNGGDRRPCWPAAFPDVVAVAGLTPDLTPAGWSDRGEWVTCSTVGEGVVSTYVEGRHPGAGAALSTVSQPTVFGTDAWASWTGRRSRRRRWRAPWPSAAPPSRGQLRGRRSRRCWPVAARRRTSGRRCRSCRGPDVMTRSALEDIAGTGRDRRAVEHQLADWAATRSDPERRRSRLALLQRRRYGRRDLLQFDVVPQGSEAEALVVRGELLLRSTELVSTFVEGRKRGADGAERTWSGADTWACWTGTSFAAPQVTGAVAAACENPLLSPRQAFAALIAGAESVPGFGACPRFITGV
jgi:subtilisin family serine protease